MALPKLTLAGFLSLLILCGLCISLSSRVFAQSDSDLLYVTTWNDTTRLSTLWRYDIDTAQMQKVFTLTSQGALQQLLSESEFKLYVDNMKAYGRVDLLPADWTNLPLIPTITAAWRLDNTHLLVQTANDARVSFGADSSEVGLYGYHEFLILDLAHPQKLTSILKFDYHDSAFIDDWYGFMIPFVDISGVAVNPTQDNLAISLHAAGRDTTSLITESILLVDYSVSPAQTQLIPLASHPVWSPDGNDLAYLKATCICDSKKLTSKQDRIIVSLRIASHKEGKTETIETYDKWDFVYTNIGVMSWVNDDTLFYTWLPPDYPKFDNCCITKSFDARTHLFENVSLDSTSNLFFLSKSSQPSLLVGETNYGNLKIDVYSLLPLPKLIRSIPSSDYATYNSRYPERVIFSSWNINTDHQPITILNADQSTTSVDLVGHFPAGEWISNIAS